MPTLRGMPGVLGSGLSLIAAGVAALMLVSVVLAFHGWPGVASSGPVPRFVAVAAPGSPASHPHVPTLVIAPAAAPPVRATNVGAPTQRPSGDQVHPFTGTSRRPAFMPTPGSAPSSSNNSAPSGSGGGTAPQTHPQPQPPRPTDPVTSVLSQVTGTQPPSPGPPPTLPQTVDNASQAAKQVVSTATPPTVSSPVNKVVDGVTGTTSTLLGGK